MEVLDAFGFNGIFESSLRFFRLLSDQDGVLLIFSFVQRVLLVLRKHFHTLLAQNFILKPFRTSARTLGFAGYDNTIAHTFELVTLLIDLLRSLFGNHFPSD